MIDTLSALLSKTDDPEILTRLNLWCIPPGNAVPKQTRPYALVTMHRPQNVDDSVALSEILMALESIAEDLPVLFPVHPRTRKRIEENNLSVHPKRIVVLDPLGYLDFLALMRHASLVITDSGGIQEETTFLKVPCITVRPNTERPVTVELGTNRLVERGSSTIIRAVKGILGGGSRAQVTAPPLWDGRAAERIVKHLELY